MYLLLGNGVRAYMPSPFDVGQRHLCWLRCLDELRCLFWLVREPALREDEEQRSSCEREEEGHQAVTSELRCGQQMRDVGAPTIASIQGRVQEDRDEDAGLRVVEDPGHDHSGQYCYND